MPDPDAIAALRERYLITERLPDGTDPHTGKPTLRTRPVDIETFLAVALAQPAAPAREADMDETRVLAEALDARFHFQMLDRYPGADIIAAIEAAGYSLVPTATLEALERVRDAAAIVLTYPGPVQMSAASHEGCSPDACWVTRLRAALEGGPT